MRKASLFLIIAGIILIIVGNFFFKRKDNAVDNKSLTVTLGDNKSFKWPVYTGVILLFVGASFYLGSRKNSKTVN